MKDILYIHYYSPKSKIPVSNKLLVIGILRLLFKHKYFYYIYL